LSKAIPASCVNSVVTVSDSEIAPVTILSQGKKASTGLAIMDGDVVTYVTSSVSDIKDLISSLEVIIQQVVIITTALDGVTTTPGSAAATIAQLTFLKTQLGLTKENLK